MCTGEYQDDCRVSWWIGTRAPPPGAAEQKCRADADPPASPGAPRDDRQPPRRVGEFGVRTLMSSRRRAIRPLPPAAFLDLDAFALFPFPLALLAPWRLLLP